MEKEMQTVILAIDYSKLHTFYKPLGIFSSYQEALEKIDGDELGGLLKFVLLEEYEVGSSNSDKEGAIYQWVKGSKEWNRTATWKDGIDKKIPGEKKTQVKTVGC